MNGRNAGEGGDVKVWKGEKSLCVDKGKAEIWFTAAMRTSKMLGKETSLCLSSDTNECHYNRLWLLLVAQQKIRGIKGSRSPTLKSMYPRCQTTAMPIDDMGDGLLQRVWDCPGVLLFRIYALCRGGCEPQWL